MALVSDILLALGAIGAAIYCLVLSRRLAKFTDLEKGMGGAIAVLSVQVEDMTKALEDAQGTAKTTQAGLTDVTTRAEAAGKRLELLLAAMHDLPETADSTPELPQPVDTKAPDDIQWRTRRPIGGALR